MTVRIAVIGAGVMGGDHARIIAEDVPGAVLKVVCDVAGERARQVAERCGADEISSDPEAVIARADVDAVIIAGPDFTHAPLALACIRAGKPALCEKPLSQSSSECLEVIAAETAAGRRLVQVGFMRRYDRSYIEMKAALDEGVLGRALMMHNFHRNVETPLVNFTGAMAITNSAPHEFDIARHVLGGEFAAVSAYQPRRSDDVVAPVFLVLETEDAQIVNIEINNNAGYGYDVRGELVGEQGSISLDTPNYTQRDLRMIRSTDYPADWRPRYADAYCRQDKAFVGFVRTGKFPQIAADCWDGYCASLVAEAGVRALEQASRVTIEPAARPGLYRR